MARHGKVERMINATSNVRSGAWKWWVCGLLLCASTLNYMDRQTLANAAVRITKQFSLTQQHYGDLEWAFGWSFAVGSLLFGFVVDRFSVRWVYPLVLLLWSGVGFATGLVNSYHGLILCRGLLGFFEAGHWPCAIKTTQQLLSPADRTLGNSLLQSGTSIGAILAPQVMKLLLTEELSSWRFAFQVVGLAGVLWIAAWFLLVRSNDLQLADPHQETGSKKVANPTPFLEVLLSLRMLGVVIVVALSNTCWQTLRAWLPKFLQEGRGYTELEALNWSSLFYLASDVGCLGAGALTSWLVMRRFSVHQSRAMVFALGSVLTALSLAVPWLPKGYGLGVILFLIGAGALGVFPVYHALTQDLSPVHQGKVTGVASISAWLFAPPLQSAFGRLIDKTHSFDLGFAIAGLLPGLAFVALIWGWKTEKSNSTE